ncbi:polyadenylate-binding protein RBP47-like [Carex rostrata]
MQQAATVASSAADTNPQPKQQQPWVHMQFPHMVMPHQMMAAVPAPHPPPQFPQHFMPFHPQPRPQYQAANSPAAAASSPASTPAANGGGGEDNKTIWVGDLHYWMDENYLASCFLHTGDVHSIKVIRNKMTGNSEGYGFVEFNNRGAAEKVLQTFGGHAMPNTDQPFRLNWASFSMGERRADVASDHSIFVGDLAGDVTDAILLETFASRYPSVKGAKVVIDANTGRSKGYGFVRFGNDDEKAQAMTEMNGKYCSTRAMRIGPATPRKSSGGPGSNGNTAPSDGGDVTNTTVFVGGLDPDVSEDDLRQAFSKYGEISSVKVPAGKQCGFVQFAQRKSAEDALQGLNGTAIGKQTVRLSWGRNPANKQGRGGDTGNQWNGMYYTGQYYNGYAYGAPFPDPSMYAAAYGSYPFYGNQQQVN